MADFFVAADDRVDLALFGPLGQVERVFLQRVVALFGIGAVGGPALADVVDRSVEVLRGHRAGIERVFRGAFDHGERCQNALHRNEAVPGLGRQFLGLVEHAARGGVEKDLAGIARDLGQFAHRQIQRLTHALGRAARTGNEVRRQTLVVVQKRLQQMFWGNALVALAHRNGLRRLNESPRPFRELLQVHWISPSFKRPVGGDARQAAHPVWGLRY